MKNKIIIVAIAYIIGIVLQTFLHLNFHYFYIFLILLGLVLFIFILKREMNWKESPFILVLLSLFLISLPLGIVRTYQYSSKDYSKSLTSYLKNVKKYKELEIIGTIKNEPEIRGNGTGDIVISVNKIKEKSAQSFTTVKAQDVILKIYPSGEKFKFLDIMQPDSYGYTVKFKTKYYPLLDSKNPGEFNYKYFLFQNNLVASFKTSCKDFKIIERTSGNIITETALFIKVKFISTYKQTITAPASKLISGATLGTRRALEKTNYKGYDISEMFRRAGVGHILAVSGLHVSIVALLLFTLFMLTGLKPKLYAPLVIFSLVIFAIITGARPSTIRAVIMNSVTIIAYSYFRYNLRNATYIGLAISSFFILLLSPPVLYSASFLLSFGAVLSLVMLTPMLDKIVCSLRGFSLFLGFSWFIMIFYFAATNIGVFTNIYNIILLVFTLYLLLVIADKLNLIFPKLKKISFNKLHVSLRSLIIAQLSIQIGMMIPLNAWFFGQFPVAGIIVNLFAIPLVGVLVQLGILTGLIGLIPYIGKYLALPLGAAASLFGDFFLFISYLGADNFSYPSVPKPSLTWMISYYIFLSVLVILYSNITKIQNIIYKLYSKYKNYIIISTMTASSIIIAITVIGKYYYNDAECTGILVHHTRNYPAVSILSNNRSAVVINPGDSFTSSRLVFEGIRHYGMYKINSVIISGYEYNIGYSGIDSLLYRTHINKIYIPKKSANYSSMAYEIGDNYLSEKLEQNDKYIKRSEKAYNKLIKKHDILVRNISQGNILQLKNVTIAAKDMYNNEHKYITAAKSPFITIIYEGYKVLIVTDGVSSNFEDIDTDYDILILPYLPFKYYYSSLIDEAIKNTKPRVLIISNGKKNKNFSYGRLKNKNKNLQIFTTDYTGALLIKSDEDYLKITSFSGDKTTILKKGEQLQ